MKEIQKKSKDIKREINRRKKIKRKNIIFELQNKDILCEHFIYLIKYNKYRSETW